MALYDFQCAACGAVFEIERPLGSTGKVKCTSCGSMRTTKMFSAAGIVFKGSGFYVTDSKKSGSDTSGAGRSGVPIEKGSGSEDKGSQGSEDSSPRSSSDDNGSSGDADAKPSKQPDSPAA